LQFFIAGLVIAGLLTLPMVNLVAPLLGAAFMVHLVTAIIAPKTPRSALGSPSV
jgi:CysZ protein